MLRQLRIWARDPAIRAVLVDAVPGRAFLRRRDIRAIYESARARDGHAAEFSPPNTGSMRDQAFGQTPYRAHRCLAFAGGMGISVHGSHRVRERERAGRDAGNGIGLFPDIGASYFRTDVRPAWMYLALRARA